MKKNTNLLIAALLVISSSVSAQLCLPMTTHATGTTSWAIVKADFNVDGKIDLAVANQGANTVSVLLGDGAGGFSPAVNYTVGTNPSAIVASDFNGDGKMDLVTANANSNSLSLLLNTGTGTFLPATNVPGRPRSLTSADFNNDGKMDLALSNNSPDNIAIMLGDGSGGFSAATTFPVGTDPRSITLGDFNGDGKVDLVTANYASNNVSVMLGNGAGSFSSATNFAVGKQPHFVSSYDFNGDGKLDLAVTNYGSDTTSILIGNGSGSFSAAANFARNTGGGARSHAIADFDGDGKVDIATATHSSVSILYGNGLGGFTIPGLFFQNSYLVGDVPSSHSSIVTADFDGNGKMDIAAAVTGTNNSGTAGILLNGGVNTMSLSITKTDIACNGGSDGSITITPTGGTLPYLFSWSTTPAQTTQTISNLTAGGYHVTVTDKVGCQGYSSVSIINPLVLYAYTDTNPTTNCSKNCNGAGYARESGGTPPFSYLWDAAAGNQTTALALNLCQGNYFVTVTDANNCTSIATATIGVRTAVDQNVYLTNLAAVDQVNVSSSFAAYYSYSLPSIITPPASNPRNFVDPGKKARFKVECTNQKINGQNIVSGICKVRSNSPYITVTDSSSALNNIGWNNKAWSADEFEIDINASTPSGTNAYIDFVVQENGQDYATTCIAIPIRPLAYSPTTPATIDDDSNPDSQGNDNDICEPGEIIEFYPFLDNKSSLSAQYVRGRFENLDNHSYINIWNGVAGVGTTVYDATWWNYSFAQPQPIIPISTYTSPEYDFVFKCNNTSIVNDFKLYMVMAGGFNLFPGTALSLVQWSLPYTFNNTSPCKALYALSPDLTTPHNWFALDKSTGIGPFTYTWNWGDGTSSTGATPSHTFGAPGNYNICLSITDNNGCSDTYCDASTYIYKAESMVSVQVVSQLPNKVAEVKNETAIRIYPNPTNNFITIQLNPGTQQAAFAITNQLGQTVLSGNLTAETSVLDVATLATGMYFIKVGEHNYQSLKLIKQ